MNPIIIGSLILSLFTPKVALASITPITHKIVYTSPHSLELDTYLIKLEKCESGGNFKALNPIDLDGTPSKGRYQFKTGTFNYFSQKYKIATTSIWNGYEQDDIVRFMSQDPTVDFHHQFPDCTRRIGLPPKVE